MLIGENLNFRNAEDMISTIEFTMDRNNGGTAYLIDNIYVENITEDYTDIYWNEFTPYTSMYSDANNAYVIDEKALLPIEGTGGLVGKALDWKVSDNSVLNISKTKISADELINYGYSQEDIDKLKKNNQQDVTVILAEPKNVSTDTKVKLTAYLDIGDDTLEKEFDLIVKANGTTTSPTPTVKPTQTPSNNGGGGGGGGGM